MLKRLSADLQLISYLFWRYVLGTWWIFVWVPLYILIVFILQWLFNIEQFWHIITDSSQTFIEKLIFLQEGFINIFRYADDIVPISLILIGFLQSTALVLFLSMRNNQTKSIKTQSSSMLVALLGSGCVACGGSILTPLLGAIASGVSVGLAERVSDILLILAVLLSYRALSKVSFVYAHEVVKL